MKKKLFSARKKRTGIIFSNLKKGELKDCSLCRFYTNKTCGLPVENIIEEVEKKRGKCFYYIIKGRK